jgi:hypothetical protein
MNKTKPNNASITDTCTQRLNALKTHLTQTGATIVVNGVQTTVADVIATYEACLDGRATLKTQRADVKATLGAIAAADSKRRAMDQALKAWVVTQYGADSKEAHDFGFPPPKAPVRTVKSKATALERSQATRKARHTLGSKQKEEVKGTMVVLVPPGNPATTVQPATPAGSTPSTVVTAPTNGVATMANGASH